MPLTKETREKLLASGDAHSIGLVRIMDINDSGFAGCDKNGSIVDRRLHPEAVPVQKNTMMGLPAPKSIVGMKRLKFVAGVISRQLDKFCGDRVIYDDGKVLLRTSLALPPEQIEIGDTICIDRDGVYSLAKADL